MKQISHLIKSHPLYRDDRSLEAKIIASLEFESQGNFSLGHRPTGWFVQSGEKVRKGRTLEEAALELILDIRNGQTRA